LNPAEVNQNLTRGEWNSTLYQSPSFLDQWNPTGFHWLSTGGKWNPTEIYLPPTGFHWTPTGFYLSSTGFHLLSIENGTSRDKKRTAAAGWRFIFCGKPAFLADELIGTADALFEDR